MRRAVGLHCRCGTVQGRVTNVAPGTVHRMLCYCTDCQAFLHHLGRADLHDPLGATDLVLVAPAALTFTAGVDRIVGLCLAPGGLYRWHSDCCNTPMGNTVSARIPFIGLATRTFAEADDVFGPPRGALGVRSALGEPPAHLPRYRMRLPARGFALITMWMLSGRGWPNPFFDSATRAPTRPVRTLSPQVRAALRPLGGRLPTSQAQ